MEKWLDIPGFEGLYQASSIGRIKALSRRVNSPRGFRTARERVLAVADSGGYDLVMLCKEGVRTNFNVHRLVALAFIPNLESKRDVNHINGKKKDNRVDNLEWATPSENNSHAFKTKLRIPPVGEKAHMSKISDADVEELIQINIMYGLNYTKTAPHYGVNTDAIQGTCTGRYRKHIYLTCLSFKRDPIEEPK